MSKYLEYREPDFLIIGGMKCGTTSLYRYMLRHPMIRPARKKEVHFFDKNYQKGRDWYCSQFPPVKMFDGLITGEASPRYLFSPAVPGRVKDHFPGIKLIALLRSPVDRAYSHYHHNLKRKLTDISFEEALEKAMRVIAKETGDLYRHQTFKGEINKYAGYLSRGFYYQQLRHWTGFFPIRQFLVIKSEDLFCTPDKTLKTVFTFLDLKHHRMEGFKRWNYTGYPPMVPGTREELNRYFRPHNRQLYEYLGRDFGWKEE